ncbi:hypothetical protein NS228_07105 [Methylobacterium indicum]|nr:hypothetical protein NS229_23120 [Methylobacterium indicum]KTS41318.1 hypothetical protein NS228_07105 [Methylobacterium indicum]KTS51265.1 hypothetical protein NS230_14685 [Methylobacterium indicum]
MSQIRSFAAQRAAGVTPPRAGFLVCWPRNEEAGCEERGGRRRAVLATALVAATTAARAVDDRCRGYRQGTLEVRMIDKAKDELPF